MDNVIFKLLSSNNDRDKLIALNLLKEVQSLQQLEEVLPQGYYSLEVSIKKGWRLDIRNTKSNLTGHYYFKINDYLLVFIWMDFMIFRENKKGSYMGDLTIKEL